MQIIRDPAEAAKLTDPVLRHLVEAAITALSEDYPYDPDVLGYFLIVEPGDTVAELDAQIGFSILANRWTGIRFDAPGYTQHFEVLDEHAGYFEMVFVTDDTGLGVEIFIGQVAGIDPDLIAMCQQYAVKAAP